LKKEKPQNFLCLTDKNLTLRLKQCFSKWAEAPIWGWFWWARGRKNKRGRKCTTISQSL